MLTSKCVSVYVLIDGRCGVSGDFSGALLTKTRAYLPAERIDLIRRAYEFAAFAHDGQLRKSGDPYITHPVAVAEIIADLQQDATLVAAALLHDVVEDCGVTLADLRSRFTTEVARLVDGATKLRKIDWRAPTAGGEQAENLRKFFLAVAEDVEVVILKLADRMHNMRTLDFIPEEAKRRRIAQETMDIYAPLANRMGIWQIKWELEDLSFRHLQPDKYKEIAQLLASKRALREEYVTKTVQILRDELERNNVRADVKGRAKHIYSIFQKMQRYNTQGRSFDQITDLLALRVLVDTVGECYSALGVVHNLWTHLPGTYDDYISSPKETGYKSLHTSVRAVGGKVVEVQIRTHEMHQLAEFGVAAHWRYKEGGPRDGTSKDQRDADRMERLRTVVSELAQGASSEDFVEGVKSDLFQDMVFIYTPKGELKDLPAGATPLDFAYHVHTDLGHRCVGAKVNGKLVPLNSTLRNGDVVEIIRSKTPRGPTRDWLNPSQGYVRTGRAKAKIRQWFKREERVENIERGREQLEKELKRLGISLSEWQDELLRLFKCDTLDDLHANVGDGGIPTERIALRLAPLLEEQEKDAGALTLAPPPSGPSAPSITTGVQVLGTGDLLTQLAICCRPVPGDDITGFVTRSRGVTVHRSECPNIQRTAEPERLVDLSWGSSRQQYLSSIRVEAFDRIGLMRDLTQITAEERINISGVGTKNHPDHTITVYLNVTIGDVAQLFKLIHRLQSVRGVTSVERMREGARAGA